MNIEAIPDIPILQNTAQQQKARKYWAKQHVQKESQVRYAKGKKPDTSDYLV